MSISALAQVTDAAHAGARGARPGARLTPRTQTALAAAFFVGILAWRLTTMARLWMTTDLERHMAYADLVRSHGLRALHHSLTWWNIDAGGAWKSNVYNYPPTPLGFFWLLRSLGIGLVGARVVLTLIDALAAALLGWRTRSRLIALAVLALPQSQRWVTGEGQYEPLQSVFTIGALVSFARFPVASGVLLALAVQSKVTAIAVIPVMVVWALRSGRRHFWRFAAGLGAGLVPSALVTLSYPMLRNVVAHSALVDSNPWRVRLDGGPVLDMHGVTDFVVYATLLAVVLSALVLLVRASGIIARIEIVPILAFCGFVMLNRNGMPWYLLLLPSFAVVPSQRRTQLVLLVFSALAGFVTVRDDGSGLSRSAPFLAAECDGTMNKRA